MKRIAVGTALIFALLSGAYAGDAPPNCVGSDYERSPDFSAEAAAKIRVARADELSDAEGLLWRIEKPGLAPSFLLGTNHTSDPSTHEAVSHGLAALAGTTVLATELGALDAGAKAEVQGLALAKGLSGGDSLAGRLTPEEIAVLEEQLAVSGLPPAAVRRLKPWLLTMTLALPACEIERQKMGMHGVDEALVDEARKRGLEIFSIETGEEQIDALASLDEDKIVTELRMFAHRPEVIADGYATLSRLYAERRPAEYLVVIEALNWIGPDEIAVNREFMLTLLTRRNPIMAERTAPLLAKGGAFVAVGALHLPGSGGLIARYRAMGYKVERVW